MEGIFLIIKQRIKEQIQSFFRLNHIREEKGRAESYNSEKSLKNLISTPDTASFPFLSRKQRSVMFELISHIMADVLILEKRVITGSRVERQRRSAGVSVTF